MLQAWRNNKKDVLAEFTCSGQGKTNKKVEAKETKKDLDIKQAILLVMLKAMHRVVRHAAKEDVVSNIQAQAEEVQAAAKEEHHSETLQHHETAVVKSCQQDARDQAERPLNGLITAIRQRCQQFYADELGGRVINPIPHDTLGFWPSEKEQSM